MEIRYGLLLPPPPLRRRRAAGVRLGPAGMVARHPLGLQKIICETDYCNQQTDWTRRKNVPREESFYVVW